MADDRNSWLDEAAAEKLLRGEPVGLVADHPEQDEAARLRQALEDLAPRPLAPGPELPGEAAALAAFRAAHHPAGTAPEAEAESPLGPAVEAEPLVALGMPTVARPARNRTFRFGLAAAVASVAIGGVAAVAGGGLLDRTLHASASPAPAVSLTTGPTPLPTPDPADGAARPGTTAGGGPTPFRDGAGSPGATPSPGGDGAATPGSGGAASIGGTTGGTTGEDGRGRTGGTDGTRKDPDGSATTGPDGHGETKDRDRNLRIADLCRDFRANRLNDDQRDRLTRAAKGAQRVKQFCDRLLDGGSGGTGGDRDTGSDGSAGGGEILEAPTRMPADPVPPAAAENSLGLIQDTRL
ncbi:hypothetical protein [Streptomyces sp. NPDC002054]|uniref:hypothetical protein n=1 Tax=Streptomyces sp. NPDC002054 TaxID=3154663 RepID=UPI00332955E6